MKRIAIALLGIVAAQAEILVYDLSFNTTGPSVNYSFLQSGYLIVDESSNAVTSVVVLTDPTTMLPYSTTGLLTGTYMEMQEEGSGKEFAVISSSSGSGGAADSVAFQILGKTSKKVDIGGGNGLSIAKKLRGYLLASAAESASVDPDTSEVTFAYGFAGASTMTANFQSGLTNDVNGNRLDAAGAQEMLTTWLENQGITPEATTTSTTTTDPTVVTTDSTTGN
jgi:hypothetical protein